MDSTNAVAYIKKEEQRAPPWQLEATAAAVHHKRKYQSLVLHSFLGAFKTFRRQLLTAYKVLVQNFCLQLEKEALVKGIPIGQALDIDIPPPRPKRKPSNPYPRKTGVGAPLLVGKRNEKHSSSISSLQLGNQILDLGKEPVPEDGGVDKKRIEIDTPDEDNCSEVFTLYQDPPCSCLSSASNDPPTKIAIENNCAFREFMPLTKEVVNQDEKNKLYNACESKETRGIRDLKKLNIKPVLQEDGTTEAFVAEKYCCLHDKSVQAEKKDEAHKPVMLGVLQTNEMLPTQSYPRHVPVYVIDGGQGVCTQNLSRGLPCHEAVYCLMGGGHGQLGLFTDSATCVPMEHQNNVPRSPSHQAYSTFHPLTTVHNNQEEFQPYLQMPSTFSSLIVSTLLQNPAAHAAASFASSFWPFTSVEASADSPGGITGFLSCPTSSAPAMTAVAAATVAAATAWWAAHGLLPLCSPIHNGFTCTPTSTATTNNGQTAEVVNETKEDNLIEQALQDEHHLDPESSEAFQAQKSGSKSPTSSIDSEESRAAKLADGLMIADHEKAPAVTELHDLSKPKGRKQVNRSSCGSNTPSSSEVETDAFGKHEKRKQDGKEPDINNPTSESSNRRSRNTCNTNDSWKEVSEEGRLAFQALFSREVLPQSFSPPHDLKNKGVKKSSAYENKQNDTQKDEHLARLDLNGKTSGTYCGHPELKGYTMLRVDENREGGLLTMDLGHAKLRARRTGFKPYKRCSLEAKESCMGNAGAQGEEKCPKRIRLERVAST
ncbi:hypothetical protein RJ641_017119 [Dillenia turbinata]|uniref:Protein LHY n=1 Tax=Dillenia turbinata TaxID=194707 RepID=A0AAN8UXI9_9MAGN